MCAESTKRKYPLRMKLALSVGSLVVMLLICEVTFRVAGIRAEYHRSRIDRVVPMAGKPTERVPYGFVPFATVISVYDSNPRGYFAPGNTVWHLHNSVGWRDVEHDEKKADGMFRILGLGDSYLWGQGVKSEDICLTKLPGLLEGELPGRKFESINAGLSAMNTVNQRNLLFERGLKYRPDLVIVHFVLNDVEDDVFKEGPKIEFFTDYVSIYESSDTLSGYSQFWGWSRQRYLRSFQARNYLQQCIDSFSVNSEGWKQCRKALGDIATICSSRDIRLLVVVFPFYYGLDGDYPFQSIHDTVWTHCKSLDVDVLDLRDRYRKYKGPELWVHPTDQHPNEIAHGIAAESIADFLVVNASQLLPDR